MKEFANIQRTCCSFILRNTGTLITCTMLPTNLGSVPTVRCPSRYGVQEDTVPKYSFHSSTGLYNTQKFIRTQRMFWKRTYRTVRRTTLVFLDYYAVFLFEFFGNIVCLLEKLFWKIHSIFFLYLKLSVMVLPVRYLVHVIPSVVFVFLAKDSQVFYVVRLK